MREQVKYEKDRQDEYRKRMGRKGTDEDEFENYIRQEKEEARRKAGLNKDLERRAESVVQDLEKN